MPFAFNAPSGGVFFAAKDGVKSSLSYLGNVPSTLIAIFVAQIPYWIVRQPSEIFKEASHSLHSNSHRSV